MGCKVPLTSEDLPEPDTPATTVNVPSGRAVLAGAFLKEEGACAFVC